MDRLEAENLILRRLVARAAALFTNYKMDPSWWSKAVAISEDWERLTALVDEEIQSRREHVGE